MSKIIRYLVLVLAFSIGIASLRYFSLVPQGILSNKGGLLHSGFYLTSFYLHIAGGITALLTGPFQFWMSLRKKSARTHRLLGYIYLIGCMVGGVSGIYIAFFAEGGLVSTLGFATLGVLWLFVSLRALYAIRTGFVQRHREWMLRSYALTFAAVTLRIWLPLFVALLGWEFESAYRFTTWWCWVPNLLVMEWYIRTRVMERGELTI